MSQAVWGISLTQLIGLAMAEQLQFVPLVGIVTAAYAGYLYYRVRQQIQAYIKTETEMNLFNISETYVYKGGTFLVAVHEGRIVGIVGGENRTNGVMELKRMIVDVSIHSRGLGTTIVEALQVHAIRLGFSKISLATSNAQPAAKRLYTKCGFQLVKETDLHIPGAKLCFYAKQLEATKQ